jgi:hypothetical protein
LHVQRASGVNFPVNPLLRFAPFAALCLTGIAPAASGEDRTFPLLHASGPQAQQELATAVRSLLEIRQFTVNTDSLTVSGTTAEISAAAWLLNELDRPPARPGDPPRASGDYVIDGSLPEGTLRVFYVRGGTPVQQLQEAATVIRSVTEIRRVYTYNQTGAIAFRGTPAQLEAAEWIWRTLDSATAGQLLEFRTKLSDTDTLLSVIRVPTAWPVPEFQEAATVLRSSLEIRRLYTYNPTRSIVMRASDSATAAAKWLANEVAKSANDAPPISGIFRMEDQQQEEGTIRVVRLPATAFDVATLQRLAKGVRDETRMRRLFTFNPARMIILRGTDSQVALAEKAIAAAAQ